MLHLKAKILAGLAAALVLAEQVSAGHFPQNKAEWFRFLGKFAVAAGIAYAAKTDGVK